MLSSVHVGGIDDPAGRWVDADGGDVKQTNAVTAKDPVGADKDPFKSAKGLNGLLAEI
jgi:hypothetical protein